MIRRCAVALASFAVAAAALALAGSAPAAPVTTAFGPGEQTTYRVSYLGLPAGTAQVTVGSELPSGKDVWPIVTLARSDALLSFFPVRDKIVAYWDASANRPLGSDVVADENHKHKRQKIELLHEEGTARVTRQKEGEKAEEQTLPIAPGTADIPSAAFVVRSRPLAVGQTMEFPVLTGTKRFPMRVTVEGLQVLKTPLGERRVLRIRVQTEFAGRFQSKRDMRLYFTDDASHVPVRMEADFALGTIVAEWTDYKPGKPVPAAQNDARR